MSVRNASSSIYYGDIDTQNWSLVSVNKTPKAELCSSLSKAKLQVVDQELLQCFISSSCTSYNYTFYLKLNKLVKLCSPVNLIFMGLLAFSLSWAVERQNVSWSTTYPFLAQDYVRSFQKFSKIKTSSSNDTLLRSKVFVSSPRPFVCLLSPTSKGLCGAQGREKN